jgi:hypothetical protein
MFLGQRDFLRRRIKQLHRDAPVCTQLLDRPLKGVADTEITADPGGFGTGGVAQNRRCRRDHHIFEVAQDRNDRIRKTQRQRSAAFHIAQEDKRQDRNGAEQWRPHQARHGRSAVTRRCREGFEYRFGR